MKILKRVIIGLSIFIYYVCCFINTDSVIEDFKNCVSTQQETNTALDRYIGCQFGEKDSVVTSEVSVRRILVVHNFLSGFMYVNYSYELYDENGTNIGGSWKVPSKWYIEKKNGRWLVVDIEERP